MILLFRYFKLLYIEAVCKGIKVPGIEVPAKSDIEVSATLEVFDLLRYHINFQKIGGLFKSGGGGEENVGSSGAMGGRVVRGMSA